MNPSSLQTEIGWGCSLTNSTLHNGVGSLGCESSIFFFFLKKINSSCRLVHDSTWNQIK
jgi:hypothetical protein